MKFTDYGYPPKIPSEYASYIPARVAAVHRQRYALVCEHGPLYAVLKPGRFYDGSSAVFPTTGDFVCIDYNPDGDSRIVATLPRKTFFTRRDPTAGRGEQAVAANFDFVWIMQSLNQNFNPNRLERYLTLAWQSGAIPVVVLTKADLTADCASHLCAAQKAAPGVDICVVSTKTGAGFDTLNRYLEPRKTIVLLGSSGVGKSSLVNALAGEERMTISEIRESDGRGRHTTSHRQLILLQNGAMLIDTPGMRELGMWDVSEGLEEAFEDVEQYLGRCKFSDCRHESEPGCAVKSAIEAGSLSPKRWESYLALKNEARYSGDKESYLREKRQKTKAIAQYQKQIQKAGSPRAPQPDYRHMPCAESFHCGVCGTWVTPDGAGTAHRNHCPSCLSSIHVDNDPGDRASLCKGIMDPIGVWVRKNGEWAIIHRCRSCGALHANRVAADDNPALLLSIAVKPLAAPPFPLDRLSAE